MPLFGSRERKDKRKATEAPSDGRGNPGKKQEVSNGSTQTPVAMATALGADIPKPSLPSNTEEFEKVVKEACLEEAKLESAAAGGSYASKARKSRVNYPFALFICAGLDNRQNLTKGHYCAFEENVINTKIKGPNKIVNADDKEHTMIDFMLYCKNSYGLVACANRNSAEWVKALASKFDFEGTKTRAWARWEQEEAWIYSLFLTGEFWKNKKPNYFLGLILENNGITGEFRNVSVDKSSNKNGIFLSFEPIGQLANELNSRVRLDCLICSSLVKKRLRKVRSEEAFLESLKKK
jgi:hypothetical protein